MAMPVILKGDTSARISFSLTDNFSYEGYSLRVDFHHVSYVIYDLKAGSTVSVQYTAEETSRFPLGTGLMTLTLENEEGVRRTLPVERVKVTDAPAEVYDGAIIIDPGVAKVEELPERFTDNDVRSKINQILSFFRRCAAFCLLGIMSYGFVAASVLTAPKGEIYNDSPVVTNVNLEGLAKTDEVPQIVTNVVRDVSDTLFNNYISATNDNFVAAVNASQVSVDDSVVAEIAEYAGVDVPTAGATSIGALFIVILGGLSALKLKKQDALSQEQMVAVNSGITADKVSKLEGIEAGAQKNPDLSGYATKDAVEQVQGSVDSLWSTLYEVNNKADAALPRYLFTSAGISDGVVTVPPYTNAGMLSDGTAFTVAVGEGNGYMRDCILIVECGDVAPTITWSTNFHPRTDAETDFACVAGVNNVYWISEYVQGEFAVAGWQATAGGSAQ